MIEMTGKRTNRQLPARRDRKTGAAHLQPSREMDLKNEF